MNSHFVFRAALFAIAAISLSKGAMATSIIPEGADFGPNGFLGLSGLSAQDKGQTVTENTQNTASPAGVASDQQNSQMNTANDHIMSIPATNPSGGGGAPPI